MKRFDEKVKDLVEVRVFPALEDLMAAPAAAIENYRFTDITSDLMAKWLSRAAGVTVGSGCAAALAGFRGVGKSHFMAALGGLLSSVDLRGRIRDEHVKAALAEIARRPYHVAFVRRGSGASLVEELRNALNECVGGPVSGHSVDEVLISVRHSLGDAPLIILIDTAAGRTSRVARDDGSTLGRIAELSGELGFFAGVALDDDIAGADGANSAISKVFAIDFLDQEHLYRILDLHILVKLKGRSALVRDVYEDIKNSLTSFRWSEQRFSSVYPLHPVIMDLAPMVRLYLHDFSVLRFASEAAQKLLPRPANSLVCLDELFEAVEKSLRAVPEMQRRFEMFDSLESAVEAVPVQLRLQAKLVRKALLLLSLRGVPSTAPEVAAAMMLPGEVSTIESILDSFAAHGGGTVQKRAAESGPEYLLSDGETVSAAASLTDAAAGIDEQAVWDVLLRYTTERLSDLDFDAAGIAECVLEWRGGLRRGEVVWSDDAGSADTADVDWKVNLLRPGNARHALSQGRVCSWELAQPTQEELETLARCCSIQSDPQLRESLGDGFSAAVQVHALALDRIWRRIFVEAASVRYGDLRLRFDDEAASSHTASQLLSYVLSPVFEVWYPSHPHFGGSLGVRELGKLVAYFLAGADTEDPEVQSLAEKIAYPIGIAVLSDGVYRPTGTADLLKIEHIKVLTDALENGHDMVPIDEVAERYRTRGLGFTSETIRLLAAALIAKKKADFVTRSGNRINYRSLDLQIIWDDIAGVAAPSDESFSSDRLLNWSRIFASVEVSDLANEDDVAALTSAFAAWLDDWRRDDLEKRFSALNDAVLNVRLWRTVTAVLRSYGAAALAIEKLIAGEKSAEDCLKRIAEVFSDSEEEFRSRSQALKTVRAWFADLDEFTRLERYVNQAPPTHDAPTEQRRSGVLDMLIGTSWPPVVSSETRKMAAAFTDAYITSYEVLHAEHHADPELPRAIKAFAEAENWNNLAALSTLPWSEPMISAQARAIFSKLQEAPCAVDVKRALVGTPVCECGFEPGISVRRSERLSHLIELVDQGLFAFADRLAVDIETMPPIVRHHFDTGRLRQITRLLHSGATLKADQIAVLRSVAAADGGNWFVSHVDMDEMVSDAAGSPALR